MTKEERLIKTVKDVKINPYYVLTSAELAIFYEEMCNKGIWEMYNLFKYGYLKGQRALKAEMKRKAVKA